MKCMICGADGCKCGGPAILSGTPVGSEVKKMSVVGTWVSDRRIYLDADGKAVEEKDPTKVELLVPIGGRLPMARALELGLVEPSEKEAASEVSNVERLTEALTAKDEELRKLESEIEAFRKAIPSAEDKAKATAESEKALNLKDEEIKKLGKRVQELESEVATLKKGTEKAAEPDHDKAVKPDADKAVKPGDNK